MKHFVKAPATNRSFQSTLPSRSDLQTIAVESPSH